MSLLAAGCGGSNANPTMASLYKGSWTGTWTSSGLKEASTISLTVLADGSFTGTMGRSGGQSGSLSGVINNVGKLTGAAGFSASGNYLLGGTVTLSNGSLIGSMAISYLGTEYMGTFSATVGSSGGTGA
jgi:hypothetical protein